MERRVDELGRIVIPNHIRKDLGLESRTKVKFETDGNKLIISKAYPTCVICNCETYLTEIDGKYICADCKNKLR